MFNFVPDEKREIIYPYGQYRLITRKIEENCFNVKLQDISSVNPLLWSTTMDFGQMKSAVEIFKTIGAFNIMS